MSVSMNRRTLLKSAAATVAVGSFCTIPSRVLAQGADTIIVGKAEEAVGWDPAMVTASSSFELIAAVYENLIIFDENGQPVPILAESWEQTDDTTWVFTLREGVTFHNGNPLTAEDVKFTFGRLMDPDGGSVWASQACGSTLFILAVHR
ncbi:MAG: ABC transporter substrate-binding protein [Thermomicrobiales bacterium]|nr:ABC transporter substrate-binding protein [Thermomicrobiales bacterium]